jgi:hypothetical protein
VSQFDSSDYGAVFAALIPAERLMPLDAGTPNVTVREALTGLTLERAFAGHTISDRDMARCCLSGVWLLHDFLDESHTISQAIATPSGSFWHGIMHRREGDFSNAKYWFERVGDHPVFARLTASDGSAWDPSQFVDDCQRALRNGDSERIAALRQLQQREWQVLFDFCYRTALGF